MLEEEGVQVDWDPRQERRGIDSPADIRPVVVTLTAVGALSGMKVAIGRFRKLFPHATAEIEDDAEPRRQGSVHVVITTSTGRNGSSAGAGIDLSATAGQCHR